MEETKEMSLVKMAGGSLVPTESLDLTPEEKEAMADGGQPQSINLSKMFPYRIILTGTEAGQYTAKEQISNEIVWRGNKLTVVILHGHHSYKLKEWMISARDKSFEERTDEDNKVVALSYDTPKGEKGSVGSFGTTNQMSWLSNPQKFDLLRKNARINIYAIVIDAAGEGSDLIKGKIVFITLPVSGITQYENLLKKRNTLNPPLLPYYTVEMTHEGKVAKINGKPYRSPVMKIVGEKPFASIEELRANVLPHVREIQKLHKLIKDQSELGIAAGYDEDETDVTPPGDPVEPFSDEIPF